MAWKISQSWMSRLMVGARMAIKENSIKNHHQSKSLIKEVLIKDLKNGLRHVFGNHMNCGLFCTKKAVDPYEIVIEKNDY